MYITNLIKKKIKVNNNHSYCALYSMMNYQNIISKMLGPFKFLKLSLKNYHQNKFKTL